MTEDFLKGFCAGVILSGAAFIAGGFVGGILAGIP